MSGLGDSVTIGILLTLIFGAVCFYLYSRISQNEKRVSLLENLLLSLKMSTEASLMGPDSVEPVSAPSPLEGGDVDGVEEAEYSEMLKEISSSSPREHSVESSASSEQEGADDEKAAAELLRSLNGPIVPEPRKMDANYESMSVKELQSLARQRGLSGVPQRKRDLIEALKKQGLPAPSTPEPLTKMEGELEGAVTGEAGFDVSLEADV